MPKICGSVFIFCMGWLHERIKEPGDTATCGKDNKGSDEEKEED